MNTSDTPHRAAPAASSALAGFPFPPPLLGIAPATACAAAADWLREVAALVHTGQMNLSALFAAPPAIHLARLAEATRPLAP